MEKMRTLTFACCLSLILLVGCSQEGLLESIEPTVRLTIDETPNVGDLSNDPTPEPNEKTNTPIIVKSTVIVIEEDPVTPEESTSPSTTESHEPLVRMAIQDLANRLDIPVEQVNVLEVREVVWPDASLGCPQPGMVYAQVLQPGLLIRLSVDNQMYFYHSGGAQDPFLCEETSQIIPQITPKEDEFVPPPDFEID
jgi:hypothetical protein